MSLTEFAEFAPVPSAGATGQAEKDHILFSGPWRKEKNLRTNLSQSAQRTQRKTMIFYSGFA